MRKKLWVLNLLLMVCIGLVARELNHNWKAARERERRTLQKAVKPAAPPPVTQAPLPPALQAAGYIDVAQQMLFAKDRNPNVVIEAVAPKPVPPFPKYHGLMNFGDGPLAILSDGLGRQRPFKTGDKVGEFALVQIAAETLTFEWDQKKFVKKFSELQQRAEPAAAEQPRTAVQAPAAAAPAPPPSSRPAPGVDIGGGVSACNPGDTSPAGTVMDGKRKVISESPFGKVCRWEPVK